MIRPTLAVEAGHGQGLLVGPLSLAQIILGLLFL